MRSFLIFLSVLCSFLLLLNCKKTESNNTPPPPRVILMEKSPDSAAVETGIDAEGGIDPNKNGIFVQWHPVDHKDLKAYDVYRRQSNTTGNFQRIAEVLQSFGSGDTTYLDLDVGLDTVYYYYVIARDENNEGERSATDHYMLQPKPILTSPINNQSFGITNVFKWDFGGQGTQYFIFRLEKRGADTNFAHYFLMLHDVSAPIGGGNTGGYGPQTWNLSQLGVNTLDPGDYRWRVDVRDFLDDRTGSESDWGMFQFP